MQHDELRRFADPSSGKVLRALAPSLDPMPRRILQILSGLVVVSILIWIAVAPVGWDIDVYQSALHSLINAHDPYLDALALQHAAHDAAPALPISATPFTYVYPPLTLVPLRLLGYLPWWLCLGFYLLAYAASAIMQFWVTAMATTRAERQLFLPLAPVYLFFPALLASGIIMGGNVVYLLYAAVLLGAARGWRHNKWTWFYCAVLVSSCIKAPLVSLVVIAVFSSRKQVTGALCTVVGAVSCLLLQASVWPSLFRHYLQTLELMFSYNRDFGSSFPGLASDWLISQHLPYFPGGAVIYLCSSLTILLLLWHLSQRYLDARLSLQEWIPVLLVGTILLNPRLIEYDLAPIALPVTLIFWRALSKLRNRKWRIAIMVLSFTTANALALTNWHLWKATACPVVVIAFATGCWLLLQSSNQPAHVSMPLLVPGGDALRQTVRSRLSGADGEQQVLRFAPDDKVEG